MLPADDSPELDNVTPIRAKRVESTQSPDWLKPRIPEGEYRVTLDYFATELHFKGKVPKLALHCHIVDFGPHFESKVARYYQIEKIIGKPEKGGRFKAKSQHSDFMKEYARCFGMLPSRRDRVTMEIWRNKVFLAEIVDVKQDSQQRENPECLYYSNIARILKVVD